MSLRTKVELYCDGACLGNPGPGGWGYLLRVHTPEGPKEKEASGAEAGTTNNLMELLAAISGLALTTPATAASGVGAYAIVPAGATAANYSLATKSADSGAVFSVKVTDSAATPASATSANATLTVTLPAVAILQERAQG